MCSGVGGVLPCADLPCFMSASLVTTAKYKPFFSLPLFQSSLRGILWNFRQDSSLELSQELRFVPMILEGNALEF